MWWSSCFFVVLSVLLSNINDKRLYLAHNTKLVYVSSFISATGECLYMLRIRKHFDMLFYLNEWYWLTVEPTTPQPLEWQPVEKHDETLGWTSWFSASLPACDPAEAVILVGADTYVWLHRHRAFSNPGVALVRFRFYMVLHFFHSHCSEFKSLSPHLANRL